MKTRIILLVISLLFNLAIQAQVTRTINVATPGSLSTLIGNDKTTVTNLTLTGTINDADFTTIRQMSALKDLNMGAVNIVNGAVPNDTFRDKTYNKIVLPTSLTKIGDSAFNNTIVSNLDLSTCTNLQSIGAFAFRIFRSANNKLDFSASSQVKFSGSVFNGCSVEVILPDNKTEIEAWMFNSFMGSVKLPSSLLTIGTSAFYGSSVTHDIVLPAGITTIGDEAFRNATIKRIVFSSSLTSIGISAFYGATVPSFDFSACPNLQNIGLYAFRDIKLTNNKMDFSACSQVKFGGSVFSGCTADVILPDNKTEIEDNAFNFFMGSVKLPSSLLTIGTGAFYSSSITNDIILPAGLTTIGQEAFRAATIKRIVFPPSLTSIGTSAFYEVTIPSFDFSTCPNLQNIGRLAFRYIKIGDNKIDLSVTKQIKFVDGTFSDCTAEVILPDNKTAIETGAFRAFNGAIKLPSQLLTIGDEAFRDATIKQIIFPASLTNIGTSAFYQATIPAFDFSTCPNLQSIGRLAFRYINIGDNKIDLSSTNQVKFGADNNGGTFSDCTAEVILPDNKTTIEANSFHTFKGSVVFPPVLVEIGSRAFYGADMTKGIILPSSLKVIGDNAFENATLPSISFDKMGGQSGVSCF